MTAGEVLVVIPCLNEAATLPALLRQQLAEGGTHRIVVADGGSSDGSREIVDRLAEDHPPADAARQPEAHPVRGRQLGGPRAWGTASRWLVRLDAHCDYPADYVARLIAVAEARRATSVTVPMVSRGTRCSRSPQRRRRTRGSAQAGRRTAMSGRAGSWIMATTP
jgi:succinoglycan biosynthesis protein ExoA